MKRNKEIVYQYLQANQDEFENGFTTADLVKPLSMQRTNLSTILNQLVSENRLSKKAGRPVLYFIKQEGMSEQFESVFEQVIGGKKGSMENVLSLAKATILYPQKSLSALMIGQDGTGKGYLAETMHRFAQEQGLIAENAPFVSLDVKDFLLQGEGLGQVFSQLRKKTSKYFVDGGLLFIENIDLLHIDDRSEIFELAAEDDRGFYLICAISDQVSGEMRKRLDGFFQVKMTFPSLGQRPLSERFALIQIFFAQEASRMKRIIRINSEVLRCLLLYPCDQNVAQLKRDIQMACANAFMRDINRHSKAKVSIFLSDFSTDIRKGFLFYRAKREELEAIIPDQYDYIFQKDSQNFKREYDHKAPTSIYEAMEKRAEALQKDGLDNQTIAGILSDSLEANLERFSHQIKPEQFERSSLSKVVPEWLIIEVEGFIEELSRALDTVYSSSILYAVSLHLASSINRGGGRSQTLPDAKIASIQTQASQEYQAAEAFVSHLESVTQQQLAKDEATFITMFLTQEKQSSKKVAILIAMHGSSTASSIAQVVNTLVVDNHAHAFDLALDKDMGQAYEELKWQIQQIDQGKGVFLLYDMGSLKTMVQTISKETGIPIRFFELPATLVALEAVRRLTGEMSLDEFSLDVKTALKETYQTSPETYKRETAQKAILTLCMSGEGAALAMKDYIEKHSKLDDTEVIALAMSDRRRLLSKIKQLKQTYKLTCIIGSYDPKLVGVPFVPMSTLYTTPIEQLDVIMYLEAPIDISHSDFDVIYDYLKEQQPNLDIVSLKRHLPSVIRKIKKLDAQLAIEQEIGLFVHTACLISRLQMNGEGPSNPNRDKIISSHKRLYYSLRDIMAKLEDEFGVEIPDDEYANMISIIKEI